MREKEAEIRNLFKRPAHEAVERRVIEEDVRIIDIMSCSSRSVLARLRKVLAYMSLVMEYHQWQQSCGETTARAYIEGIGKTYESHKHHFSHGEKILKYERGAVPAISVIFVSSWTAALHNNDVDGFIKGLKTRHEELYKLFEENTNWLNECQSLYDGKFFHNSVAITV